MVVRGRIGQQVQQEVQHVHLLTVNRQCVHEYLECGKPFRKDDAEVVIQGFNWPGGTLRCREDDWDGLRAAQHGRHIASARVRYSVRGGVAPNDQSM